MYIPILPSEERGFRREGDLIYDWCGELTGYCVNYEDKFRIVITYNSISPERIISQLRLRQFAKENQIACLEEQNKKIVAESLRMKH